ncbi:hypothetical protein [Natribacillus halophilus]|uniref:Uncharacterized protein n=1 Tax=Natribacillus halophilus TaxID=549003 RepID=A0A1G8RRC7_9BACI|nr:hypothetical protein [Natribacillus halophilus]SDJ19517.1 hypothetical protein SAMN04488123_1203 [Natribacillus halophilus]
MTKQEMYEMVMKVKKESQYDYYHMGVRFEDMDRNEGDIITEVSRHNPDREDERDFPEYGTDEYEEMEKLDGISAWEINHFKKDYKPNKGEENELATNAYIGTHAYVIASDDVGGGIDDDSDEGEIILKDAVVLANIF